MHIVIGGASGFLGEPLTSFLRGRGHDVTTLIRSGTPDNRSSLWDPASGNLDQVLIDSADAVINLSGAPVAHWPWTAAYRHKILVSRTSATATLARAIAASPKPPALVSASGMSAYGSDRGSEVLTEKSSLGKGFLTDVVHQWEAAASPAADAGARVCFIRTSLVLDKHGGTLKTMLPIFRLGLGGKLSTGKQYFSVISLNDWVRAAAFLVETETASGPFNFANPNPSTNAEFTTQLSSALRRPAVMRVPGFAIKTALGRLSDELLGSLRVVPEHLQAEGFVFEEPDLESTIAAGLR
ncbi:MAG: TIGR01777 family oxidoreductase [Aeromicrobium sp.]